MKAMLFVRHIGEGWHSWPGAPERRSYLRSRHRHLFHLEARTQIEATDDRELEYHDVRDALELAWATMAGPSRDMGEASCETMARRIGHHLIGWSSGREWTVRVSEDGEAGAEVTVSEPNRG